MWLRVLVVFLLCFFSFGDFFSVRTKRQDVSSDEKNKALEFFNNCSCVYNYQCDFDNFIITNGKDLVDPRLGQGQKKTDRILCAGGDFEGEFVCCKHKPGEENVPPVTTRKPDVRSPLLNRTCGRQLPNINVRIFADESELTPVVGEFPWLVAIFKKNTDSQSWQFHASGSLIHPGVVLTSNHVVVSTKANELKVIANGHIELPEVGKKPNEERNIKEIVKHEDYSSGMLLNDVALLILEEPYNITHTPSLNTLCLKPDIPYENKKCLVAGWGRTPSENGVVKVLKKVELPALTHSKCRELLSKALRKSDYTFHESLMCAGGEEGRDACKGDGGSPLMCPTGTANTMYQVGMVAWGIGCGKKDVPGVYGNVRYLHSWIMDKLKNRKIEI